MSPRSQSETHIAVHAAKELFWRRGYEDASIEEVVQATGFNRYALYTAFGGKREIFLAALDAYYQERRSIFLTNLDDPETAPLDAIRRVFEFAITEMAERGTGCLMCNVATGAGPLDPLVAERIETYLEEIRCAYIDALERAQSRNELNPVMSIEAGAALLITLMLGLGVHAKRGASAAAMLGVFDSTLTLMASPRAQ